MIREYLLWLAKTITKVAIFFVIIFAIVGLLSQHERGDFVAPNSVSSNKPVGVVKVEGMIMDSKETIESLYNFSKDPHVKGIVLRVDSPGGAIGPSQEINSAVRKVKEFKPIVVSMGSVAASGGLYASLSASKILSQPGTITGSIGVIMQYPNLRKLASLVGLEMVTVKSGELKDVGNMFRETTPEELNFIKQQILKSAEEFMLAVSEGRNIPLEEVRKFADGRIILGSDALKLNLIDGFGDIYDAARLALELAHEELPANEFPRLIYNEDKWQMIKRVFEGATPLSQFFSTHLKFSYLMP